MNIFELLHHTAVADTDLLRKNDEAGDIFTIAREVDFAFESDERERADDFAEFVNGKSYGKATVREIADGDFQVIILITMPITQHVIGCVSGFMLCLSRLFQIEYLGWGSVIQKPPRSERIELVWPVRQQAESTFPDLSAAVRAVAIRVELGFVEPYPVNGVRS